MMRISIVTGVVGAFVVLSAPPASAEKLTLACTFESGNSGTEQDVNQVIFDTDRPLKADGRALPERTLEDVGQDEEPEERSGAPGARGGVALALARFMVLPKWKPDEGDYSHAENNNRNRGHLDDGKSSCHAPVASAVERRR